METGLVYAICGISGALIFATIAILVMRYHKPKHQREAEARLAAKRATELAQAVRAGTHDDQGYPLCRVCGPDRKVRATHYGVQIRRSNGLWDWFKRTLGAPSRFTPQSKFYDGEKEAAKELCRVHFEFEMSLAQEEVLAEETHLRQLVRDSELRLGYSEEIGLHERARELWDAHCAEMEKARPKPRSSVVPFPKAKAQ
jgi:hypothetical protein